MKLKSKASIKKKTTSATFTKEFWESNQRKLKERSEKYFITEKRVRFR